MKLTEEDHLFIKASFFIFPNKKIKETNQITGDGYFSRYLISTGLYLLAFWLIATLIMGDCQSLSLFLKFIIAEIIFGFLISLFVNENVPEKQDDSEVEEIHNIHNNTSKLKNELMFTEQSLKNKVVEVEKEQ